MKQTPNIITIENKKLIGNFIETSLANNKTFELFSGFMPNKKHIKNAISEDVYEVMIYDSEYLKNFNPKNTFTKWVTVEIDDYENIPENMKILNLAGGLYAVFNYKGLPQGFGKLMNYVYSVWLPKSEYQLDNRPHFNILGEKYKRNSPDAEETVYIPIQLK